MNSANAFQVLTRISCPFLEHLNLKSVQITLCDDSLVELTAFLKDLSLTELTLTFGDIELHSAEVFQAFLRSLGEIRYMLLRHCSGRQDASLLAILSSTFHQVSSEKSFLSRLVALTLYREGRIFNEEDAPYARDLILELHGKYGSKFGFALNYKHCGDDEIEELLREDPVVLKCVKDEFKLFINEEVFAN